MKTTRPALLVAALALAGCDLPAVIEPPVEQAVVKVSPDTATLIGIDRRTLSATVTDPAGTPFAGRSVTWSSSDTLVATVTAEGLVQAVAPGTATIRASSGKAFGSATVTTRFSPGARPPAAVPGGHAWKSLEVSPTRACGLTVQGSAYCWVPGVSAPAPMPGGPALTELAVGGSHTCGLAAGGTALCWGANQFGQLGDGTTTSRATPTPVGGGLRFVSIAAGSVHTCAATSEGAVFCWGESEAGQTPGGSTCFLPDWGPYYCTPVPTRVPGDAALVELSAHERRTCGLTAGGKAYCWGEGPHLGTEAPLDSCFNFPRTGQRPTARPCSSRPLAVDGDRVFAQVDVGSLHSCGVTVAGAAYCWGYNGTGQLGNGTLAASLAPVAVQGAASLASITTAAQHTCAITRDSATLCWGRNDARQLGADAAFVVARPLRAGGPAASLRAVAAAGRWSCGIAPDGTAYCWGGIGGS